jgi:hypothetical protein
MSDTTHEAPDNLVKWLRIHASQIGIAGFGSAAGVAEQAADRIEELEAKLAKAVENTLDAASAYMTEQYGISALSHPVDRARVIAPLAELKGQTNE